VSRWHATEGKLPVQSKQYKDGELSMFPLMISSPTLGKTSPPAADVREGLMMQIELLTIHIKTGALDSLNFVNTKDEMLPCTNLVALKRELGTAKCEQ